MRYIEKKHGAPAVQAHEHELASCQLNETSLLAPDSPYAGYSGSQLYELVRDMKTFPQLKGQLLEDQHGICCYCGMKLEYPFNPQYRVEHVRPKETHRELVGEYGNLLLSCRPTTEETAERNDVSKKERKAMMHCDEAKASSEITYSPLRPECEHVFVYRQDGAIEGTDPSAKADIETLGLDCAYLKRRRKEALDMLYDGDELLPDDLLREIKDKILIPDADNKLSEFCFVISNVIEQLLSQSKLWN